MIPSNLIMSRESRKLIDNLERLSHLYKIGTIVTLQDVYMADQLTQKYYIAPIHNMINRTLNKSQKLYTKHFKPEYWFSVADSMFSNNTSVRRDDAIPITRTPDIGVMKGFELISKYLISDYSVSDARMIHNIVHCYNENSISDAILKAKQNNVYNVRYINAILEKEQALSNIKMQQMDKLRQIADNSNSILNRQKVQHSVIDMATNQYNWEQSKQNAELERMIEEKFGK